MSGRIGQILAAGISQLLQQGRGPLSDKIHIDFLWLRALSAWTPWRKVRLDFCRPKVVIISDASWEPDVQGLLCWWVYSNCAEPLGQVCHVPASFWKLCQQREAQIVMGEIPAALLPVLLHPSLCVNAAITAHIDSIAVWHATQHLCCFPSVSVVRVGSKLVQPGRGGSRVGTQCSLAAEISLPLTEVQFPDWFHEWMFVGPAKCLERIFRRIQSHAT